MLVSLAARIKQLTIQNAEAEGRAVGKMIVNRVPLRGILKS
jgi:hypothetical protein